MAIHTPYQAFCRDAYEKNQHRKLVDHHPSLPGQVRRDVRDLINFSGNDYLGLSRHRHLRSRAISYAQQWGVGATASRLMSGNLALFDEIERKLASAIGSESTLILSSGFQLNATVLAALADTRVLGKPAVIFCDKLNHNSLLQAAKLAGAELRRYRHNDLDHLAQLLQSSLDEDIAKFIVSETLFGMDGDRADIPGLIGLAKKHDAFLYLDDAHAVGVYGKDGFGLAAEYAKDVDLIMGTFGKAFGSFGAYVACSNILRDYLINRCDGFKYSTALPPMVLGCIDAAIELMPTLSIERAKLLAHAAYVRSSLRHAGFDVGSGDTHIIPVILGDEQSAMDLNNFLQTKGILAVAVRPPTVPPNTSRLRLSLSSMHTPQHLDQLIRAMQERAQTMDPSHKIAA